MMAVGIDYVPGVIPPFRLIVLVIEVVVRERVAVAGSRDFERGLCGGLSLQRGEQKNAGEAKCDYPGGSTDAGGALKSGVRPHQWRRAETCAIGAILRGPPLGD